MVTAGIRQRKKQATRRAISDIATALFMSNGFDNTTIAEIADAAGVSAQTVANYFPTKTDLFFDEDTWLTGATAAIDEYCPQVSPAQAMLRWYLSHLRAREIDDHLRGLSAFRRTIVASPALRHRYLDELAEFTDAIHGAIAARFPRLPAWESQLVAGTLTAALDVCENEIARLGEHVATEKLPAAARNAAKKIFGRVPDVGR